VHTWYETAVRRILLVVLAAAAAVLVAYVLLGGEQDEAVAGGQASLIGDSLMVGVEPYVDDHLPGWSLAYEARNGRTTAEGLDVLRRAGSSLGRGVAVSLGTNDDPSAAGTFRASVREALDLAGPHRCLVWVNLARPPLGGVSYARLNRVLDQEADAHDNLRIVDWAALVRSHPEWIGPDGVHATEAGYDARAAAIASALLDCAAP
jgi:GDSL-like Lipase/Acylhydrolase family